MKKLKFYSAEGISSSVGKNAINPTYYNAGDIVTRDSDGTTWICVKPAGGPSNEKNSYWMCLSPFATTGKNAGNCIIKEDKKKVWLSYSSLVQKNWVYAKNLMSLDTAKAAYHTFNALVSGNGSNASSVYSEIKAKGYDIAELSNEKENFCFAYGSPKNDKARISRGNYKIINSQTNYVQPFFIGSVGSTDSVETTARNYSTTGNADTMLAVTDAYDINYLNSFYTNYEFYILKVSTDENDGYTYLDYIHHFDAGRLSFKGELTWMKNKKSSESSYPYHVIYSPELTIKDSGKAVSGYTDVYHSGDNSFDYWGSL